MAVDMASATHSATVIRFDQHEELPDDQYTIIAVSDGRRWSALCRELDIASDGDSAQEAAEKVLAAVGEARRVAAEEKISAGSPVPDSALIAFMASHVGSEPVSTFAFNLRA